MVMWHSAWCSDPFLCILFATAIPTFCWFPWNLFYYLFVWFFFLPNCIVLFWKLMYINSVLFSQEQSFSCPYIFYPCLFTLIADLFLPEQLHVLPLFLNLERAFWQGCKEKDIKRWPYFKYIVMLAFFFGTTVHLYEEQELTSMRCNFSRDFMG